MKIEHDLNTSIIHMTYILFSFQFFNCGRNDEFILIQQRFVIP